MNLPKNVKFIVTSPRHYELDAASEIWHCLRATGICEDARIFFPKSKKEWIRGLILVDFDFDPIEAIEKIRKYLEEKPWIMEYMQRIIPVEFASEDINVIKEKVREIASKKIKQNDSWRITVSKHASKYGKFKIIEEIADVINWGKVNLENPDWIINIEVIKDTFYVAIIKKNHIIRKKEIKRIIVEKA